MERLADDPGGVRRMGARGREQEARYDWKAFCETVDAGFERMIIQAGAGAPPG